MVSYTDLGTKVYIAFGTPDELDQDGVNNLFFYEIDGVVSLPQRGTSYSQISEQSVNTGFTEYFAGMADGGVLEIPVKQVSDSVAESVIAAGVATDDVYTIQEVSADGETATFYYGKILGWQRRESSTSSLRGHILSFGVDSEEFVGVPNVNSIDVSEASLFLDFANGVAFADLYQDGVLKPYSLWDLLTFTRASTATYFDADGVLQFAAVDEPRFDHDPVTGEALGVLVEESATNECPLSVPSNDYWPAVGCTLTEFYATAPDGTESAALLTWDQVQNNARAYRNASAAISGSELATVSVFVKASPNGGTQTVGVVSSGSNRFGVTFDFTTQTAIGASGGDAEVHDFGAIYCGDGWWRIWASGKGNSSPAGSVMVTPSWNISDTSDEFLFWGAQLEAGGVPTSYIPTSGAAVTRSADSLYIDGTKVSEILGGSMPDAVSLYMRGDMSYADIDAQNTAFTFNWVIDSQNRVRVYLDTSVGGSGTHRFQKAKDGAYKTVSGTPNYYEPGVGVPFSVGARMAQHFINGCMDGVTLSIKQYDEPLADLSSTDIGFVTKGFGHVKHFALFTKDVGDEKLSEITS